jgi:hypothetical protein
MPPAPELSSISPSLFLWQAYDPAVKAELFSTAIVTTNGIYLVDPTPLDPDPLNKLVGLGSIRAIIVTNANHWRAAPHFAAKLSVPIFGKLESRPANCDADFREIYHGAKVDKLSVVALDGAAPGEIALFMAADSRTLIVGDALINFEPFGFALLPAKYCTNHREMRRSLQRLLDCKADRILFAHGTPILSGATERLRHLLNDDAH